jgi:hypothetical protein
MQTVSAYPPDLGVMQKLSVYAVKFVWAA